MSDADSHSSDEVVGGDGNRGERGRAGDNRGVGNRTDRAAIWRVKEWVLLDGNRLTVAGLALGFVTGALVGSELLGWIPVARDQPVFYVFGSLISGNLTLITVVVSINQLLLSREFESPGQLETQMQNVIEYRREVEEHADEVAPVEPLGFLELLFSNTRREAQRIGGMTFGTVSPDVRIRIDDTVESLTTDVDRVLDILDESGTDTFEVLSTTLRTNYARDINRIRRIRATHSDDLPETVMDALENLVHHLQNVDVARQYFKSLYLQQELSSLSRNLLYAGIPAETVSVLVLLAFTARRGTTLLEHVHLLLPVTVAVGFLPLSLLFAYVIRIATVTQRTAATIPFTTPEQEE